MANVIARLTVFRDGQPPSEYGLTEDQLRQGFTIGADRASGLALDAPTVSGRHAELRLRVGQLQLVCLSKSNPIIVGANRLVSDQHVTLTARTEFQIAPFRLLLEPGEPGRAAPPAPAAPLVTPAQAPASGATLHGPPPAAPASAGRVVAWPIAEDRPGRYLSDLPAIFRSPPATDELEPEAGLAEPAPSRDEQHGHADPDDGQFLGAYLKIFEAIWEPWEQRQDHLEQYFDPATCPEELLARLAGWIGVEALPGLTVAQLRRMVAAAGEVTPLRGTRKGLRLAIRACTGVEVAIHDVPGQPYLFRVVLPPESKQLHGLVEQLIQAHKPAYMGYILE